MRQRIIQKPQINSGAGKKPDSVKPKSGSFQSTFDKVPEYLWQRAVLERRISCCRWLAPCGMWRTLILKPRELWTMTVGSPSGHTPLCGTGMPDTSMKETETTVISTRVCRETWLLRLDHDFLAFFYGNKTKAMSEIVLCIVTFLVSSDWC